MNNKFKKFALSSIILVASCFSSVATAGIIAPSEAGYSQVYGLNIGTENLHNNVPYYLNISSSITNGSFSRIAYHMELQRSGGPLEWVWVSMDAFTNDASKIGVPSFAGSNTIFQQLLSNMNVFSNVAGITTGSGISTGNIEFWPYNYSESNSASIPNASNQAFDSGDTHTNSFSYGSMQIHNHASNQTIFALNRFSATTKDIGIGNRPISHPDWTFAQNSNQFTVKTLDVWVSSSVPTPSTLIIFALGLICLSANLFRKNA